LDQVAWRQVIFAGWPVLSVLFAGSIITIAVVLEKWRTFSRINTKSKPFLESISANRDPDKILKFCKGSDQPLAIITGNIYKTGKNREEKERTLTRTIQALVQNFETHLATLGTIASVAPFVGLLGTVIGIIRAFRSISMTQGGATAVALGISEALVGTAGGLVVAIPALIFYNYYTNKIRRLTQDWEIVGQEIIDLSLD